MAKYVQPNFIVDSSAAFLRNVTFDSSVYVKGSMHISSPETASGETPYALVVETVGANVQVKNIQLGTMATKQSADYDASLGNINSSIGALDTLTQNHTSHLASLDASIERIDASLNDTIDALTLFPTIAYVDGSLNAKLNLTGGTLTGNLTLDDTGGFTLDGETITTIDTSANGLSELDTAIPTSAAVKSAIDAAIAAGVTASNGLTEDPAGNIKLGGALEDAETVITTAGATNTLAIAGLQTSTLDTALALVQDAADGAIKTRALGSMAWEASTNYYSKPEVDELITDVSTSLDNRLDNIDTSLGLFDTKFADVDSSLADVWTKFGNVDTSFGEQDTWNSNQDASIVAAFEAIVAATVQAGLGIDGTTTPGTFNLKITDTPISGASTELAVKIDSTGPNGLYIDSRDVVQAIILDNTNPSDPINIRTNADGNKIVISGQDIITQIASSAVAPLSPLSVHDSGLGKLEIDATDILGSTTLFSQTAPVGTALVVRNNTPAGTAIDANDILTAGIIDQIAPLGPTSILVKNTGTALAIDSNDILTTLDSSLADIWTKFGYVDTSVSDLDILTQRLDASLNTIMGGSLLTASNGLTASGQDVKLGGTLTQATDIITDGNLLSITGGLSVFGTLTVDGSVTYVNSVDLNVSDNIITVNSGETGAGVSKGFAGLKVDRGTEDDYVLVFGEATDTFRIGIANESGLPVGTQAVATREDTPTGFGIGFWNGTEYRIDTSAGFTFTPGVGLGLPIATNQGTEKTVLSLVDGLVGSVELGTMAFEASINYFSKPEVNVLLGYRDSSISALDLLTQNHTLSISDLSTGKLDAVASTTGVSGHDVYSSEADNVAYIKKIVAGTGATITSDSSTVTISVTGAAGYVSKFAYAFTPAGTQEIITAGTHGLGTGPFTVAVYELGELVYTGISYASDGNITLSWGSGALTGDCSVFITG